VVLVTLATVRYNNDAYTGNLHIDIVAEDFKPHIEAIIEPFIYEWVSSVRCVGYLDLFSGSISAEHGLGFMKADMIGYSKSSTAIRYMKQIKHVFDPKGLMNPYKLCSDEI